MPSAWLLLVVTLLAQVGSPPRDARPAPAATGSISGRVLDERSGTPMSAAQVTIVNRTDPAAAPPVLVLTNDRGEYVATGLRAASYVVLVRPPEHRATHIGQIVGVSAPALTGALLGATSLTLAAGERREGLDVALVRAAAFEGRVLDDAGRGLAGMAVTAQNADGMPGGRGATTDDRGAYRVYGLAPGEYRLCSSGSSSGRAADTPLPRTCHPALGGGLLRVAAGETVAVDIHAIHTAVASISGTVVSSSGAPLTDGYVRLERDDPFDSNGGLPAGPVHDGTFTLRGVPPGTYRVSVSGVQVQDPSEPSRSTATEYAVLPLRVDGTDISGIALTTTRLGSLRGRVVFEGVTRSAAGLHVQAVLDDQATTFGAPPAIVAPDGTFVLQGTHGPFGVAVTGLPDGWFVQSAALGERDVLGRSFEPPPYPNGPAMTITISNRGGRVRARVRDADGRPVSEAMVVLLPADADRRRATFPSIPRSVTGDVLDLGVFRPGDYLAIASPVADVLRHWRSFRHLDALASRGTPLVVRAGEEILVDLPLIRAAESR